MFLAVCLFVWACVRMCMHAYVHTWMHALADNHAHLFSRPAHACTHVHACVYVYAYSLWLCLCFLHVYVRIYACIVCMYLRMYVCMYVSRAFWIECCESTTHCQGPRCLGTLDAIAGSPSWHRKARAKRSRARTTIHKARLRGLRCCFAPPGATPLQTGLSRTS